MSSVSGIVPLPGLSTPGAHAQTGFPETSFYIPNGSSTATKNDPPPADKIGWNDIFQPKLTPSPSAGWNATPHFVPQRPYELGGLHSSGIFEGAFSWDNGDPTCNPKGDLSASSKSQSINKNPWSIDRTGTNVSSKTNLCSAAYAMEALSDSEGLRHFLLYGYITRETDNSAASIDTVLKGTEPGRCGDLLLDVQFPEGDPRFLDWRPDSPEDCGPNGRGTGPGQWVDSHKTVNFVFASGKRTEGPGPAGNIDNATFMEFGVDLTTAGLFSDAKCSSFSLTETVSRPGSRASLSSSSLSDFLDSTEPLDISNCGRLTVRKETPGPHTADEFRFRVTNQSSQGVVIPPNHTSIEGILRPGDKETYTNVLSSSQLRLEETYTPPPWEKQSIECSYTDAAGVTWPTYKTAEDPYFTLIGGSQTDCVITNNVALVTVEKVTYPPSSTERFAFDVGPEGDPHEHTPELGNGQSATFAVRSGVPITMNETVPSGWQMPTITCRTAGSEPVQPEPPPVPPSGVRVTPVFGQNITCTFTNTENATVTIEKRVPESEAVPGPGPTFPFEADIGGTTSQFPLTPTEALGNTGFAVAENRLEDVKPGRFSVTQVSEHAGYYLADLVCYDDAYPDREEEVFTPERTAEYEALPGSDITCSFTDAAPGTLIVDKATLPTAYDEYFPFTVSGPEGFNSGVNPAEFKLNTIRDKWSQSLSPAPAGTYTITEDLTTLHGWDNTDVECRDQRTQQPLATAPTGTPGEVTVVLPGDAVVRCTYTNRAEPADLTFDKTVENVGPEQPWEFHVSLSPAAQGPEGPAGSQTVKGEGSRQESVSWRDLVPGESYVVSETDESGSGWNMGRITCSGERGPVTEDLTNEEPPNEEGELNPLTFKFTAKPGQKVRCQAKNVPRLRSAVNLTKVITGIGGAQEWSYSLQLSKIPEGAEEPEKREASGNGPNAATYSWVDLVPGQRYKITEPDLPDYVRLELACTSTVEGFKEIEGGFEFVAPLGATEPGASLNCTLTNFYAPVKALLRKTTEVDGDFTFELTNLDFNLPDDIEIHTENGEGTAEFDLAPGVPYSLKEEPPLGLIEGQITCTETRDGVTTDIDDVEDFTVPAGASVACQVHNSRAAHGLVVRKAWVNGVAGDTAGLAIDGATTGPGFAVSTAEGRPGTQLDTANQATRAIGSGDQVTVTETLPAADHPANTGSYTTDLKCLTNETTIDVGLSEGNRRGTFIMPEGPVVCTFTNDRTSPILTLTKFWENGAAGDTAELSINGATAGMPGFAVAAVPAGGTGPSAQVVTGDAIGSGSTVTVTETLPGGNTGSYAAALECVTGDTRITVELTDGNRHGTFTMPSAGAVACVFTNTRTIHHLTVAKFWANGAAGDTAELSINGATTAPGFAVAAVPDGGTGLSDQEATGDAIGSGAEVRVTETLPATGRVNTGSYLSDLECLSSAGRPVELVTVSVDRRDATFRMPAEPVTCTFTNTRSLLTVHTALSSQTAWVGETVSDTAHLSGTHGEVVAPALMQFRVYPDTADGNTACKDDATTFGTGGEPTGGTLAGPDRVEMNADGMWGPVTETFTEPGTYHWVAYFFGDSDGHGRAASGCTDPDETLTVKAARAALGFVKRADTASFAAVGDLIHYTFIVSNTGNVPVTDVMVRDARFPGGVVCGPFNLTVEEPGNVHTCEVTYRVTPADVAARVVANVGYAAGTGPGNRPVYSRPGYTRVPLAERPALGFVKRADTASFAAVGDPIHYTFIVSNTGNVLVHNVRVHDARFPGEVACTIAYIPMGQERQCTVTYYVTAADVAAGVVANAAYASGTTPGNRPVDSEEDTASVPLAEHAVGISVTKTAVPPSFNRAGQVITYSYLVTNTGNVTLEQIEVRDSKFGVVGCPGSTLAAHESMTCTRTYTTTAADVRDGHIVNAVGVSAITPFGAEVESPEVTLDVPEEHPSASIVKTAGVRGFVRAGQTITYSYRVTNTGSVPLHDVTVTDSVIGAVSCPHRVLRPGESMTCTARYTVTYADVRRGYISNTATVAGKTPSGSEIRERSTRTLPFTGVRPKPPPPAPMPPITKIPVRVTG